MGIKFQGYYKTLKLLLPVGIAGFVIIFLYVLGAKYLLLLIFSYALPPTMFAGRLVMLFFVPFGITIAQAISGLVFVDSVYSAILAWNFDLLTKIPKLGKLVLKAEYKGYRALETHKWVKNLALLGVAVFVALPLYGTNAIIGTIVGRLIGLRPLNTWLATILGSILGAMIIAIIYGLITIIF
ncbi:MAG: small multi-drug export protein [Candidatus Thermoplasmatota archaeon]|nr:small multi-drug export protein [Candidatus Thermoplasmatota archaeon]